MLVQKNRSLAAWIAPALLALFVAPAAAADEIVQEGRVGAWKISAISDNTGRFTRCVGELSSSSGMLQLAWSARKHEYFISWPKLDSQVVGPTTVTLRFDRGFRTAVMTGQSSRPSVKLTSSVVDNLMRANENVFIDQGGKTGVWPLKGQDMTDVFVAVENCVHKHER